MKNLFKPNTPSDYLGALFIVAIFFSGIVIYSKVVIIPANKPVERILVEAPKCDGGYDEYRDLVSKGQSLVLDTNHSTYARDGVLVGMKKVVTRRGGELACGYLYAQAHKGTSQLEERYDSIYVNPQGLGGHLLRSRSLDLGTSTVLNKTSVLFALQAVPYLPSVPYNPDAQNFESTDWIRLINSARKIEYLVGLSTLDSEGKIDEIRVAYKCWDPATGNETTDCQLGLGE